ncbi:hypothetical protein ACSBR2_008965 [Camellia fascicularis]
MCFFMFGNLSMSSPSASVGDPITTSQEEEDHLIRSTKKIKSKESMGEQDMEITAESTPPLNPTNPAEATSKLPSQSGDAATDPPKAKSFKEALALPKSSDFYFDDAVDALFSDNEGEDEDGDTNILNDDHPTEPSSISKISLPMKLLQQIRKPWTNTPLIVRLLGKSIGYRMLCNRVKHLWAIQEDFDAIDLGNNYFLFKFSSQDDCNHVYMGGPWVIVDHYLTIRKWEPDFKASEAFETPTAVWVKFPELPIEYFQEKVLYTIARQLGKPLKIDLTTAMATRGKYARVCIEMDLNKPLCPRFLLGKKSYNIEYESIHSFCFFCGRVDHRRELCRFKAANQSSQAPQTSSSPPTVEGLAVTENPSTVQLQANDSRRCAEGSDAHFGPWMLVTKKTRRPTLTRKAQYNGPSPNPNRFAELGSSAYQEEGSGKGEKTNRLGLENEASSSVHAMTPSRQESSIVNHRTNHTQKPNLSENLGQSPSLPTLHTPSNPRANPALSSTVHNDKDNTQKVYTPILEHVPPIPKESVSESPEISMEVITEAPSNSLPSNPLSLNQTISLREGKARARKPPDPDFKHGRGEEPPRYINPQDGRQHIGAIVRDRDRSNSPSRHSLVDRANI